MTKKEMEQCRSLPKEIASIESAMKHPKSTVVVVFYKDYRTGRGIPKTKAEEDGGDEEIRILKKQLQAYRRKLAKQLVRAEKFIESVENSELRTILRMYYITGMSQEKIGEEMYYSQGRVSQILNEFWLSQGTKANRQ